MVTEALGWRTTYFLVGRVLSGHWESLHAPSFGPIELMVALLVLFWSPRRIAGWRWSLIVAWSLLEPAAVWMIVPYVLGASPPSWYPASATIGWLGALHLIAGLGTAPVLGIATGSAAVAFIVAVAAVAAYYAAWNTVMPTLLGASSSMAWAPKFAFATAVGGALAWWVWSGYQRIRPEWACQACGYDLRGLAAGADCPECGARESGASAACPPGRRPG